MDISDISSKEDDFWEEGPLIINISSDEEGPEDRESVIHHPQQQLTSELEQGGLARLEESDQSSHELMAPRYSQMQSPVRVDQ